MSVLLKENMDYKVKIDVPNAIELISETFDNVLNYMLPEMVVFGGILRDIIAGFGIHHDLDIATSCSEGKEFIHYLEMSSKWIEECVITQYKEQAKIMEKDVLGITSPHSMENGMLDLNRIFSGNKPSKPSIYGNIRGVRTFIDSSGHKLQIITSKSDLFTLKEAPPINIVKTVDFICCGLMMDVNGNVYEIVEGAKDDCAKRILRINKNADIKLYNLINRIKKLTARGWKSEINLTKLKHKQIRLEKTAKGRAERLEKQQSKFPLNYIQIYKLQDDKVQMTVNTSKMRIFEHCSNSSGRTLDAFYRIFRDCRLIKEISNCQVEVSYNVNKHIIISIYGKNMEIILDLKNALSHIEHKFLPDQKDETDTKKRRPSKEIPKFTDQPYRFGGKIHDVRICPEMYGLAGLACNADSSNIGFTVTTTSETSIPPEGEMGYLTTEAEPIVTEESVEIEEPVKVKISEEEPAEVKMKLREGPLKKNEVDDSWEYGVIVAPQKKSKTKKSIWEFNTQKFNKIVPEDLIKQKIPKREPHKNSVKISSGNDGIESEALSQDNRMELTNRWDDLKITKEEKVESVETPLSGITAEGEELLSKAEKTKLAKYSALNYEYTASCTGSWKI